MDQRQFKQLRIPNRVPRPQYPHYNYTPTATKRNNSNDSTLQLNETQINDKNILQFNARTPTGLRSFSQASTPRVFARREKELLIEQNNLSSISNNDIEDDSLQSLSFEDLAEHNQLNDHQSIYKKFYGKDFNGRSFKDQRDLSVIQYYENRIKILKDQIKQNDIRPLVKQKLNLKDDAEDDKIIDSLNAIKLATELVDGDTNKLFLFVYKMNKMLKKIQKAKGLSQTGAIEEIYSKLDMLN